RGRIAGLAHLDHVVAANRQAIAVGDGIASRRAATVAAGADHDGWVHAMRGAHGGAAGVGVDGAGIVVVARRDVLRARRRRIGELARFDHVVATDGHAIGIGDGVARGGAAAFTRSAGGDGLVQALRRARIGRADDGVGGARVVVVAVGQRRAGAGHAV